MKKANLRVIISGGGTGGHVFPAISIANELKESVPGVEILFVGAEGKLEMEKVPAAGYKIIGLPVRGFQRRLTTKNISFFFKLMSSMSKARKIISDFKPDVVVGVGGYASGPVLRVASRRKIPTLIQEQNSYAGVTNRILASRVNVICVAYDEMDKYFPADKIVYTGNPIRRDLLNVSMKREEGLINFNFRGNRKVLLVLGGSLGARTLNQSIQAGLEKLVNEKVQVIWQTGRDYYQAAREMVATMNTDDIQVYDFINRMDLVYAIADVIISRAGASTVSELCMVKKPAILVPSPNVAEDHQTKNAMALVNNNAAMMVEDKESVVTLVDEAIKLLNDDFRMNVYRDNIAKMAVPDAAKRIVNEISKLLE
jgi:UDP-N-acetylglucosamine--N-acetylmuramyl-(pentapeptide) pyrophosphoryl-undecaprenol N-acetylglucosamine transferase